MTKNLSCFKVLIFVIFCTNILSLNAQVSIFDKIYTKDGRLLYVMLQKGNDTICKYRYYGQKNDSVYLIAKSKIDSIRLKNGLLLTQDNLKPSVPVKTRPYFDVELGLIGMGVDGISFTGVFDVNAGIHFRNIVGIGVSYIGWGAGSYCCSTGASGVGGQIRLKTSKRLLLKFDVGYILKAHYGDDGPYESRYNYDKSNKTYIRLSPTIRFGHFTTGLTWASTMGQVNDNFEFDTKKFLRESHFSVTSTTLTIGLTFPK